MMKCEWILCPVCGSKTRNKIRKDTVLENYPLYCPKCRQESLIKVDNLKITVIKGFCCKVSKRSLVFQDDSYLSRDS